MAHLINTGNFEHYYYIYTINLFQFFNNISITKLRSTRCQLKRGLKIR